MEKAKISKIKTTAVSEEKNRVYEIGFHLIPTMSEEEVAKEVNNIKNLIEKAGGVFMSEGYPKMRPLEYVIKVPISMPKARFSHAQFGWIKFEACVEAPLMIKEGLFRNENIIRLIIVKTSKENTFYGYKLKQKEEAEEKRKEEMSKAIEDSKVSDEEIDKSIEEIIV